MAVNPGAQGHAVAKAARDALMQEVTSHQVAQNPTLQAALGGISKDFAGAVAQIQSGAAEARVAPSQAADKGAVRGA